MCSARSSEPSPNAPRNTPPIDGGSSDRPKAPLIEDRNPRRIVVPGDEGVAPVWVDPHQVHELAGAAALAARRPEEPPGRVEEPQLLRTRVGDDDRPIRHAERAADIEQQVGRVAFHRADAECRLVQQVPAIPRAPRQGEALDDRDTGTVSRDACRMPVHIRMAAGSQPSEDAHHSTHDRTPADRHRRLPSSPNSSNWISWI
jgi:hypothetical protein